jgi:hypothetical protein
MDGRPSSLALQGERGTAGGAGCSCHGLARFVGNLAYLASRKERGIGARGQPWMEAGAAGGARRGSHGSARFLCRARKGGAGRAGSHGWKSALLGERGVAAMDRQDSRVVQGKGERGARAAMDGSPTLLGEQGTTAMDRRDSRVAQGKGERGARAAMDGSPTLLGERGAAAMDRRDSRVAQGKGERGARAAMDGSRRCWGSEARLPWIGEILASRKERGAGCGFGRTVHHPPLWTPTLGT